MNKNILIGFKFNNQNVLYSPFAHKFFITNLKQNETIEIYKVKNPNFINLIENYNNFNNTLYNYYEKQIIDEAFPLLAFIIITNRCNMQCDFCYANANTDNSPCLITEDDFKKLKKIFPKETFNTVNISGGEPLLEWEKVKQFRKYFENYKIYTNGSLLDDEKIKWILDNNVNLYINLDFKKDDVRGHDYFVDVRERLIKLIEKYPKLEEKIECSNVLNFQNLNNFENLDLQSQEFEKKIKRIFLLYGGDYTHFSFNKLLNLIDYVDNNYDQKTILSSIFGRFYQVINLARMNTMFVYPFSCDYTFTVSFDKSIVLCHTLGSNSKTLKYFRVGYIDDFTPEKYKEALLKHRYGKFKNCFTSDCIAKGFCGGICWSNISANLYNCYFYQYMLIGAIYFHLKYNELIYFNQLVDIQNFLNKDDLIKIDFNDIVLHDYSHFNNVKQCNICKYRRENND